MEESSYAVSDVEVVIERLREQLREKDDAIALQKEHLQFAGLKGKELLDQCKDWAEKYEQLVHEKEEVEDDLKQALHDKSEAALKLRAMDEEKEYFNELESENQDLKDQLDAMASSMQKAKQEAGAATQALQEQVNGLACAESEASAKVAVLTDKTVAQQKKIEELEEALRQNLNGVDAEAKLSQALSTATDLEEELSRMKMEKCQRDAALLSLENRFSALQEERSELQHHLSLKTEQLRNAQKTADSYANDIHSLEAQLEEFQQSDNMGTGTDLFSEIEDKRQALEVKVGKMKSEARIMKSKFVLADTQRRNLRQQVMTMMGSQSSKADEAKIRRLEEALSQSESDRVGLEQQMKKLKAKLTKQMNLIQEHHAAFGDQENSYIEYLQSELEDLTKQNESLRGVINHKELLCLSESSKVREANKNIHALELRLERMTHELIQKNMEIDELKSSLEAAKDDDNDVPLEYVCKKCKEVSVGTPARRTPRALGANRSAGRQGQVRRLPLQQHDMQGADVTPLSRRMRREQHSSGLQRKHAVEPSAMNHEARSTPSAEDTVSSSFEGTFVAERHTQADPSFLAKHSNMSFAVVQEQNGLPTASSPSSLVRLPHGDELTSSRNLCRNQGDVAQDHALNELDNLDISSISPVTMMSSPSTDCSLADGDGMGNSFENALPAMVQAEETQQQQQQLGGTATAVKRGPLLGSKRPGRKALHSTGNTTKDGPAKAVRIHANSQETPGECNAQ